LGSLSIQPVGPITLFRSANTIPVSERALGLTVSPGLLVAADEVIE
jgi:hypothetical protein